MKMIIKNTKSNTLTVHNLTAGDVFYFEDCKDYPKVKNEDEGYYCLTTSKVYTDSNCDREVFLYEEAILTVK